MHLKKSVFILFFLLSYTGYSQFKSYSEENKTVAIKKNPISFSHQPFLLLKFTPTAVLGRDNVFQFGAEIAPLTGKFSFGFDYGRGKGSASLNKTQKMEHPEQQTTIFRGEIRAYFSDWYPFYALDKKPFGRYYSVEVMQKNITYSLDPTVLVYHGIQVPGKTAYQIKNIERAVHFKFGKHFLVTNWFFIDGFVGLGIGQYNNQPTNIEVESIKRGFSFKNPDKELATKGLFLSKTAGIRLCLAI